MLESKIKALRKAVGLTQKGFAYYFGISCRTIEKWESGRTSPPDYLLILMEYKLRKEGLLNDQLDGR